MFVCGNGKVPQVTADRPLTARFRRGKQGKRGNSEQVTVTLQEGRISERE